MIFHSKYSHRIFAIAAFCLYTSFAARAQQPAPVPPPPASPQNQTAKPPEPQKPEPSGDVPLPQKTPAITSTTGLVHLVATVMDHHRNFITDLDQADFKVSEDGTPQQIRYFGRETYLPLRIGILLDTSNSIRPRLDFEKDAALDFLQHVLRRNKDQAFVMTFDNEPEVIQDYTGDLALLTDAIRKQRAGGGTALLSQDENCLQCHPAQRGPYVFEHEAMREGCTTCHAAHGSVNAKLLTVRDSNLCLKCHFQQVRNGAILIGGSDHTARLQQGTCWTAGCHEAVHGSRVNPSLRF